MTEPQTYPNRERFFQGLSTFLSSATVHDSGHWHHLRKIYVQCALAGKGHAWASIALPLVILRRHLDLQEPGMDEARLLRRASMELERLLELQHISGAREGVLDEAGSPVTLNYMRFEDGNVDAPTTMVSWIEDKDTPPYSNPQLSHSIHICGSVPHVQRVRDKITVDFTWRYKEIEAMWRKDPKAHLGIHPDQLEYELQTLSSWVPGYQQMKTNPTRTA